MSVHKVDGDDACMDRHSMRGQLSLESKNSHSRSSAGQNSGSPAAAGSC